MPILESLNLQNNQIATIGKDAFDSLTILTTLNLQFNQLTTPLARWFLKIRNLQSLLLNGNPWVCDCKSIPFAQLLEGDHVNPRYKQVLSDTVYCTAPQQFAN